jgi:hypothetical protein
MHLGCMALGQCPVATIKCSQTYSVAVKQRGRGVLQNCGVGKSCILAVWRWAIVGMRCALHFYNWDQGTCHDRCL